MVFASRDKTLRYRIFFIVIDVRFRMSAKKPKALTIIAKSAVKGVNLNIKYFELTDIPAKVQMRFVWSKEREEELKEYIELFLKIFKEIKST